MTDSKNPETIVLHAGYRADPVHTMKTNVFGALHVLERALAHLDRVE